MRTGAEPENAGAEFPRWSWFLPKAAAGGLVWAAEDLRATNVLLDAGPSR